MIRNKKLNNRNSFGFDRELEGNAFALLNHAMNFGKQLGYSKDSD